MSHVTRVCGWYLMSHVTRACGWYLVSHVTRVCGWHLMSHVTRVCGWYLMSHVTRACGWYLMSQLLSKVIPKFRAETAGVKFILAQRRCWEWNPQGKWKRGRPRSTWRRSVETEGQTLGHSWGQLEVLSQDRVKWRKFVVDLCSTRSTRV